VVIGAIAVVAGLTIPEPFNFVAMISGVIIAAVGLLQVAAGQMLRATIDSADYARQSLMLQIAVIEQAQEVDLRIDDELQRSQSARPQRSQSAPRRDERGGGVSKTEQGRPSGLAEPQKLNTAPVAANSTNEGIYRGRRWRRTANGTVECELLGGRFKEFASLEEFKRYID
jgi:hypothetical protein